MQGVHNAGATVQWERLQSLHNTGETVQYECVQSVHNTGMNVHNTTCIHLFPSLSTLSYLGTNRQQGKSVFLLGLESHT